VHDTCTVMAGHWTRLLAVPLPRNNPGQVVHTCICLCRQAV